MDPTTTGKFPYPERCVNYQNSAAQSVSPWAGQTIPKSDPWWH